MAATRLIPMHVNKGKTLAPVSYTHLQAAWTQRVKDLEARYREEENTMIHSMVHAANLTPEQLARIIELAAKGAVGIYPEPSDGTEICDEEAANYEA